LSIVARLFRGILAVPWTVAAFVVLMVTTASLMSARRIRGLWHGHRVAVPGALWGATLAGRNFRRAAHTRRAETEG
jgi:putative ABC transport system permease protein